ncbi:MAG: hypothetical protein ACT4OM_10995 [Actinomycetota bacterium]
MEVLTAVVLGIAAGILIKTVFAKEAEMIWSVVLGAAGGLVTYFLSTMLSEGIYEYIATLGTATVVAGVLYALVGKFGKTA